MYVEPFGLQAGKAVCDALKLLAHGSSLFFNPKSLRLLEQSSLRRKVENFWYCLMNEFLK